MVETATRALEDVEGCEAPDRSGHEDEPVHDQARPGPQRSGHGKPDGDRDGSGHAEDEPRAEHRPQTHSRAIVRNTVAGQDARHRDEEEQDETIADGEERRKPMLAVERGRPRPEQRDHEARDRHGQRRRDHDLRRKVGGERQECSDEPGRAGHRGVEAESDETFGCGVALKASLELVVDEPQRHGVQDTALGHRPHRRSLRHSISRYNQLRSRSFSRPRSPARSQRPQEAGLKLQEYRSKEILARHGVPLVAGETATTPTEARGAAERIGGPVVVKAQVLVGGRGKAGGVKLAQTPEEAEARAREIIGLDIKGTDVKTVLVAPAAAIAKEYYLGLILDRGAKAITVIASAEGGVEIEETARTNPEAILRLPLHPLIGLQEHEARRIGFFLGIPAELRKDFGAVMRGLYRAFVESDADWPRSTRSS